MSVHTTIGNSLVKGELRLPDDYEFHWWQIWYYRFAVAKVIRQYGLKVVGVKFKLIGGSFSGSYILLESGVELHLWPKERTLQLTVHLCDYTRNNHQLTLDLFTAISSFFGCYPAESIITISRTNSDGSVELCEVHDGRVLEYGPIIRAEYAGFP